VTFIGNSSRFARVLAALALLCFGGQAIAAEFEHLSEGHSHCHLGMDDHSDPIESPSNEPGSTSDQPNHHHHLSDMVSIVSVASIFRGFAPASFFNAAHRTYDGPSLGIDYPPQRA
jgi:hypothetical protein